MQAKQLSRHPAERLGFCAPIGDERGGVGDSLTPAVFGDVPWTLGAECCQGESVGGGIVLHLPDIVDVSRHLSIRSCLSFGAWKALLELQDCSALFEAVATGSAKIERFWSPLGFMCATSSVGFDRLGEGAF